MKKIPFIPLSVKIVLSFSVVALSLWLYLPVQAASIAWDGGGGDANWNTGANWVGDVAPGSGDIAVFDATACGANCNPTINVDVNVLAIDMQAGTHTITQASTRTLTVVEYDQAGAGNVFVGGDSLIQIGSSGFSITGGTFTPTSGTWNVTGLFNFAGGTISGTGKTLNLNGVAGSGNVTCTGNFNTLTGLTVNIAGGYSLSQLSAGCTLSVSINTTGAISGVLTTAVLNATGSTWASGGIGGSTPIAGTINFDGTTMNVGGSINIASGGVLNLPNATTFVVGYQSSSGDLSVVSGGTLTYGGTNFEVGGYYSVLNGTFDESGKNLTLGGSAYTIVNCTGNFNTITGLNSVVMNKNNTYGNPSFSLGTGCTLTLDSVTSPTLNDDSVGATIQGTLNITGNVNLGGSPSGSGLLLNVLTGGTVNFTGDTWVSGQISVGGTFTATTADYVLIYGALYLQRSGVNGTFNAPALTQLYGTSDGYTGDFYIYGGTFNAGSGTLKVTHDFWGSSLFNAGTGTVVLNGTNQRITSGSSTFYNFTATSSVARTLTFTNGTTQIITNELTIKGASGALTSLVSNSSPTQWKINGQGTNLLCYLSVKDSNNLNATALSGYQLTDATGNTNWDFVSTSACSIPTPTVEFSATTGSGNEATALPTITVALSATSASNVTVEYGITGGTATGSGTDYTLASGTATILAGATTTTIPLTVADESTVESDETVIISLSSPSNATLGSNISYTYTITNDDVASSLGGGGGGNGPITGTFGSFGIVAPSIVSVLTPPVSTTTSSSSVVQKKNFIPVPVVSNKTQSQKKIAVNFPTQPKISPKETPITTIPVPIQLQESVIIPMPIISQTENLPEVVGISESVFSIERLSQVGELLSALISHLAQGVFNKGNRLLESNYVANLALLISTFALILKTYFEPISHTLTSIRDYSDLMFVFTKIFNNTLSFLGLRRKKQYWGTVYDSQSKQPLDPVLMELVDVKTGTVVDEAITDMAGRFGFLILPGTFTIRATKTHYAFPSTRITDNKDEIFDHLYHGETFSVLSQSDVIAPNIPMDPLAYDWNQEDKKRIVKFHPVYQMIINAIVLSLFWISFSFSFVTFIIQPVFVNFLNLATYCVVLLITVLWPAVRLWGKIYDQKTGNAIASAILSLSMPLAENTQVSKSKSAPDGKFFLKAPKGQYDLKIAREGIDVMDQIVIRKVTVSDEGVLNKIISV